MFRFLFLAVALLVSPAVAEASQSVRLNAGFRPNKLGSSTTIAFGFHVTAAHGGVPSPLTSVDVHLPGGMGLAPTTLGLANCYPETLLARGLEGCSPNARIGFGAATAEIPFGSEVVREKISIVALIGPPSQPVTVLYYADGLKPLITQLVFPAQLLPDSDPFGEHLSTMVPPTPTLPEAPDATIVDFRSTLGPAGLTYYKRIHGKTVAFHPTGMVVPKICPPKGFPFAAEFTFLDGTKASAETTVLCPSSSSHGRLK